MTSVKTFHIRGEFRVKKRKIPFGKYVRAVNEKDALEYVYDIREITDPEEIKDSVVKAFAVEDDLAIPKRK